MEKNEKLIPKYSPGDVVNVEVEITECGVKKNFTTGKLYISYRVCPTGENSILNSILIGEEKIQD